MPKVLHGSLARVAAMSKAAPSVNRRNSASAT